MADVFGTDISIWSLRFSPARGWNVHKERNAADERNAQMWLDVFRADEPTIVFHASVRKPRIVTDKFNMELKS
jgi:hypothetical protein